MDENKQKIMNVYKSQFVIATHIIDAIQNILHDVEGNITLSELLDTTENVWDRMREFGMISE